MQAIINVAKSMRIAYKMKRADAVIRYVHTVTCVLSMSGESTS